ncbi:hypothetical protein WMY93_031699 [Mugilogobius chulae]|uniref:Uncharacterized protein n=1 Tax=Mugilogobius chulae TaxID=88201 RepID=A0AAW0MFP2_9GOBI
MGPDCACFIDTDHSLRGPSAQAVQGSVLSPEVWVLISPSGLDEIKVLTRQNTINCGSRRTERESTGADCSALIGCAWVVLSSFSVFKT